MASYPGGCLHPVGHVRNLVPKRLSLAHVAEGLGIERVEVGEFLDDDFAEPLSCGGVSEPVG